MAGQLIRFVLPEGSEAVSGGNLYNAGLLQVLERRAVLETIPVAVWRDSLPRPGIVLVDSLDLASFAARCERLALQQQVGEEHGKERFVLIAHHLPSLEPGSREQDPARLLEARTLPGFDAFLTTSTFTSTWIAQRLAHARLLCLEPPIAPLPPARGYKPGEPLRALMACNLIERKGVLPFLQTLSALAPEGDWRLDIVGRTDLQEEYARECARTIEGSQALAGHVILHGAVSHAQMSPRYQGAHLLLSASAMESFGIALQEARYHGLPILAVRGGNSENHLRDGGTGLVFGDADHLARHFADLLVDSTQLIDLARAAMDERPSEAPSWDSHCDRLLSQLEEWFARD